MLCERCNKNQANIHIVKVINGIKQEVHLCDKCAKEQEVNISPIEHEIDGSIYFQNILSGIMDYINQSADDVKRSEAVCDNCGMTYSEFKEKGLLGCDKCYTTFKTVVAPMIKRVQRSEEHIGKVPKKGGKELMDRRTLLKLKEELQKSILEEEYEKAAELRDKIKELQGVMERGKENA